MSTTKAGLGGYEVRTKRLRLKRHRDTCREGDHTDTQTDRNTQTSRQGLTGRQNHQNWAHTTKASKVTTDITTRGADRLKGFF